MAFNGSDTEFNFVQFCNKFQLNIETLGGNTIFTIVQLLKAPAPIFSTDSGRLKFEIPVQALNALLPISINPFGKLISVISLQPLKQ